MAEASGSVTAAQCSSRLLKPVPPPAAGNGPNRAAAYTPATMDLPIEVSPQEAHAALAGGAFLLDVREPWESQERRIPGAVLIPLVELRGRIGELPEDRDIYVHCRVGGRSRRAVDYLRQAGRPRSVNVAGGIDAWEEAGLPVIR